MINLASKTSTSQPDKRVHIVHLIEALGSGGAERLLFTNLKHLDSERFKHTVVTVYPYATHWKEPIQQLGVEVVCLNCEGYRGLPTALLRLVKLILKWRPDLIHTHLWSANIIGRMAGALVRVPVISSVHNPEYEREVINAGTDISEGAREMARLLDRWTAYFGCRRMVAVSNYVGRSAARHLHYPVERIDLLYNPIDVAEFRESRHSRRKELADELGLPGDSLFLLNVARVSPQKGLIYAIRALPEILKNHPNAHLVSVGVATDQNWATRIQDEATSLGVRQHFHLLGARHDIPDLLRSCNVFVFPSLYEGLGIALLEAMASGCACVATETGPIPEVIRHGIDGLLVAPEQPQKLAEAVHALLVDPVQREALGKAAAETVQTRFHPQIAAEKLERIYESVLFPVIHSIPSTV